MIFHIYNYEQRGETEVLLHGKRHDDGDSTMESIIVEDIVSDVYFLPTTNKNINTADELLQDEDDSSSAKKALEKDLLSHFKTSIKSIEEVERKNIFHKDFAKKLSLLKVSFTKKVKFDAFESDNYDFMLTEFSNPIEQLIVSKKLMGCALIEFDEEKITKKKKGQFISIDRISFLKPAKFKKLSTAVILTQVENTKITRYIYHDGKNAIVGELVDPFNKQNTDQKQSGAVEFRYFDRVDEIGNSLESLIQSRTPDLLLTHNFNLRKIVQGNKILLCDMFTFAQATIKGRDFSIKELAEKYAIKTNNSMTNNTLISDANTLFSLYEKMNVLNLAREMSEISGFPISKCFANSRAERIEYTLLHSLYEKNFLFPLNNKNHEEQRYTGGLVLEPEKGYYDNIVLLLDFNSLYPSIIQEFNVCFSSIEQIAARDKKELAKQNENENANEEDKEDLANESVLSRSMHQQIDEEYIFLPKILNQFVKRRREVKKQMISCSSPEKLIQYDTRQKVLKLTANSIYGCLGFANSRFCNFQMASYITARGRYLLQETKSMAEQLDMKVIYGDTDSIMILTKLPGTREYYQKAKESVTGLSKMINAKYKHIEIELESLFSKLVLYMKKKYAGLVFDLNSTKLELKGLEIVRRDYCGVSSELCRGAVEIILDSSDLSPNKGTNDNPNNLSAAGRPEVDVQAIYDLCLLVYQSLEKRPLSDFTISTVLGKELEFYGENHSLQHVKLGMRLKKKGINYKPGDVINYVMGVDNKGTNNTNTYSRSKSAPVPFHIDEKFTVDYTWYIKNQLLPPLYRILSMIKNIHSEKIAIIFNTKDVVIPTENMRALTFFSDCCDATISLGELRCSKCRKQIDKYLIRSKILKMLRENTPEENGTCVECERVYKNALTECFYCKKPLAYNHKNKEYDDMLRNIEINSKEGDLEMKGVLEYYSSHSGYRKIDMGLYFKREIERYRAEYGE